MKRKTTVILVVILSLVLSLSTAIAFAGTPAKDVKVVLNGSEMTFDVNPIIEDGRTLVPFRAIFEALGCTVDYKADADGQHVSAIKKFKEIKLDIGTKEMIVNGDSYTLDVGSKIVNSRTLVPLRAVAEALGANVDWNNETRTVTIDSVLPLEGHKAIKSEGSPYEVSDFMSDGIYNVELYPSTIRVDANGNQVIDVRYYGADHYDIVDIATMSVGDTIEYRGNDVLIESIDDSEPSLIEINEGYLSENVNGITLISYEDSNGWETLTTDIYPECFPVGSIKTVVVSTDLTLSDALGNIEPTDPARSADYSNYAEYMKSNYPDDWDRYSTTIRIENNKIVEIIRSWIP